MKKLVILGGGFAGSYIAKLLEREFDTTLIDDKDYFEFTPGVLRTIVEPEHIEKIQALHRSYLRHARIIVGEVSEATGKYVLVKGKKIYFDYLVICSGSRYSLPIKEGGVVSATRAEHLRECYDEFCKAKRILIIGGGLVGVELAGEICTHFKDKEISIIHSHDRLMERNNLKSSRYAGNFLREKGVNLIFNDRVKRIGRKAAVCESGKKFGHDFVFLATGIKPNFEFMKKRFSGKLDKGWIKVNQCLQLFGEKNIFVAGDVAGIKEEKTAQNARAQAKIVVHNLRALERGGRMAEYKHGKRLMVISLGKFDGIIEFGNFIFGGKIPALMKWGIEREIMWEYKLL